MNIAKVLTTVDTHTAGGPTRTITGGLPPLCGRSVAEKMEHFRTDYDAVRKLLLYEPRGHKDMYGAVVTAPTDPEADIGAFFFTTSGYLPACVHSSIGVATAGLETGFIAREALRPDGSIRMEIPAGLISLVPTYAGEQIQSVAIQTAPAFVHTPVAEIVLGSGRLIQASIVFSGVFFALVDAGQLALPSADAGGIGACNARELADLGVCILEEANRTIEVGHPDNPGASTIELVMLYQELEGRHARDIVVNRNGGIDRSPCGAGTGAKVADCFTRGVLETNQDYVLESFLGTRFVGRVLRPSRVGSFEGVVPQVEGTAHVTGMHQFVLDAADALSEGFVF